MSDLRSILIEIRTTVGVLTPAVVVDAARPKDHPLHHRFEWNNEVAGESWRREQARQLIKEVKVRFVDSDGKDQYVRAFHPVFDDSPDTGIYEPIEEVVENPIQMALLLASMRRDWEAMKRRWEHMDEFWQMVKQDANVSLPV